MNRKLALQALGLTEPTTETEIREAKRKLSQTLHPDRPTGDIVKFQLVQQAATLLLREIESLDIFEDIFKDIARRAKE